MQHLHQDAIIDKLAILKGNELPRVFRLSRMLGVRNSSNDTLMPTSCATERPTSLFCFVARKNLRTGEAYPAYHRCGAYLCDH